MRATVRREMTTKHLGRPCIVPRRIHCRDRHRWADRPLQTLQARWSAMWKGNGALVHDVQQSLFLSLFRTIVVDGTIDKNNLAFGWADGDIIDLRKGAAGRTTTSRFSTTRPSKVDSRSLRGNERRVSPTT